MSFNNKEYTEEVSGVIEWVKIKKDGESKGRRWTLYSVFINGEEYISFDDGYSSLVGQSGTWKYKETVNTFKGVEYTNLSLAPLKEQNRKNSDIGVNDNQIENKLDAILDELDAIKRIIMGQAHHD